MRVKCLISLILITAVSAFGFSWNAWAGEDTETTFNVKAKIGTHFTSVDDYKGRVGEFESLTNNPKPYVEAIVEGGKKGIAVSGYAHYWDDDEQMYGADLDFRRYFRTDFEYNKFMHRLDHDPLVNITGDLGKVIKDDYDPNHDYIINHTEIKSHTQVIFPNIPSLKVDFNYRGEMRRGHRQAIAFSMCARCHVMGYGKSINQSTDDYSVKLTHRNKSFTVAYNFFYRIFREHEPPPVADYVQSGDYDPAQYIPKLLTWENENVDTYGTNRVLYPIYKAYEVDGNWKSDASMGRLPFDAVPTVKKLRNSLKVRADLPYKTMVYIAGAYSTTSNKDNGADQQFASYDLRFSNHFLKPLNFTGFFRYKWIDNDDIERIGRDTLSKYITPTRFQGTVPSGIADLGYTSLYKWYWDIATSQITNSALSRKVYTFGLDVSMPLPLRSLVKLSYERENIDRDHFETSSTTKNECRAFLRSRPIRDVSLRGEFKYDYITNPFTNIRAAGESPMPSSYAGLPQSYILGIANPYLRTVDLSNQPNRIYAINTQLSWRALAKLFLSLKLDYTHSLNGDVGWEKELVMPTFNVNYTPSPKLSLTVAYGYQWMDYETPFVIPAMALGTGLYKYDFGYHERKENYDSHVHFIMLEFDSPLTERFRVYGNTTFNLSRASFDCDDLGVLGEMGTEHFNEWLGYIGEYSQLHMKQYGINLGASYQLTKSLALSASMNYYDFNDVEKQPYNQSGKAWVTTIGMSWNGF